MEPTTFIEQIKCIDGSSMGDVLERLEFHTGSAADEIAWWEDTLAIQRVLRRSGLTRVAARYAHDATSAVQAAAERAGFELPDDRVTRLARAAAEVARGLVAGRPATQATGRLLTPWLVAVAAPVAV